MSHEEPRPNDRPQPAGDGNGYEPPRIKAVAQLEARMQREDVDICVVEPIDVADQDEVTPTGVRGCVGVCSCHPVATCTCHQVCTCNTVPIWRATCNCNPVCACESVGGGSSCWCVCVPVYVPY